MRAVHLQIKKGSHLLNKSATEYVSDSRTIVLMGLSQFLEDFSEHFTKNMQKTPFEINSHSQHL